MRKLLLYSFSALLLAGCAEQIDLMQGIEVATRGVQEVAPEIKARSLEGAVYNEVVDAWMVPQPDPYTLENFQKAYDNLAAKKSAQTLTKAQAAEFTAAKKLEPTHYALKIYPRNEDEQWKVEMMEDVDVAYIPFDWVQLPQEEAAKLPQAKTRSIGTVSAAAFTFAEKSPYTVTYDYTGSTDGGPTGPVTYQLPILYTVWPIDKPLPDDLEYVIDYEVFLPRAAETQSVEVMDILENEAVSSALGVAPIKIMPATTRALPAVTVNGTVKTYDNSMNINVPMPNLKVKYTLGSNSMQTFTNPYGYFSAYLSSIPAGYSQSFTFTFQDPNQGFWKITTENSTNPHEVTVSGGVPSAGHNPLGDIILAPGNRQANVIHRAVAYYYSQWVFKRATGGTRIIAQSGPHSGGWYGSFTPNSTHAINIYNSGRNNGPVFGTTLHELGHFVHHWNDESRFSNTHSFIKEAFSSYMGWYLGEAYYETLGWTKTSDGTSIIGEQGRQTWVKNNSYEYSPLFVDLTDNYNQRISSYYSSFPNDNIQGVPPSVVWDIVTTCTNWNQCRTKLHNVYMGTYFTTTQFEEWIQVFDEWVVSYY